MYIDGNEVTGSPANFDDLGSSAGFVTRLGAGEGAGSHRMKGAMDDVRIYEGALTSAEVAALVPEPSTLLLASLGLLGLIGIGRRRKR